MAKLFISPLFIVIVLLWPLLLFELRCVWKAGKYYKMSHLGILALLLILTLVSMPAFNKMLSAYLEMGVTDEFECPVDTVVVLGGGVSSVDLVYGETMARIAKGVQVLEKCGARRLVLSGRSKDGPRELDGQGMQMLALAMGVPKDKIVLEMDSINTWTHPICLERFGIKEDLGRVAVVSAPWHLKRVDTQFRQYYPNYVPIAAYSYGNKLSSVKDLIPQVNALVSSNGLIHEYAGILYYYFLKKFPGLVPHEYEFCVADVKYSNN